jgi:hypothetical protein
MLDAIMDGSTARHSRPSPTPRPSCARR